MASHAILDLDDTLCDYSGIARQAQAEISASLQLGPGPAEDFWRLFESTSAGLYRLHAQGKITLGEFRIGRFLQTMECFFGGSASVMIAETLNKRFMDITNDSIQLFPDALDFLEYLKDSGVNVLLFTNGPDLTQRMKIRALGIEGCFQAIHTSQETGHYKPDAEVYRFLMGTYGFNAGQAVNIGDSPEMDLPGAKACGIRSILVNRGKAVVPDGIETVASLSDLRERGLLASGSLGGSVRK